MIVSRNIWTNTDKEFYGDTLLLFFSFSFTVHQSLKSLLRSSVTFFKAQYCMLHFIYIYTQIYYIEIIEMLSRKKNRIRQVLQDMIILAKAFSMPGLCFTIKKKGKIYPPTHTHAHLFLCVNLYLCSDKN